MTVTADDLTVLLSYVSGVSVATERTIAIFKTLWPWLGRKEAPSEGAQPRAEEGRRILVTVLAFVVALMLILFLVNEGASDRWVVAINGRSYGAATLAFLSLGGSAFWAEVIGVLTAVKDIRKAQCAAIHSANRSAPGPS